MPDPRAVEARIAEVLREHAYVAGSDDVDAECVGASCTWHGAFLGDCA